MSREVLILREPEIRALLDPRACIAAMEQAFAAYSTGTGATARGHPSRYSRK